MAEKAKIIGVWLFSLLFWLTTGVLQSQNTGFDIYLDVNPQLTSSEILDLSKMATGERVPGRRILTVNIQNNSNERVDNLYLDLTFSTEQDGVLWEVNQNSDFPFFIRQGQRVFASNNDLARGRITGVPGNVDIRLDIRLTENGRQLMNRLQHNTGSLPFDYTIEAGIYKDNNRQNGGTRVAGTTANISLQPSDLNRGGNYIVLMTPGNHMESRPPVNISNPYPEFRWEGSQTESYRVVVVERQPGQNPENLIRNAKDTQPGRLGESVSLLDFENADVLVEGTGFQYPSYGVVPLQTGKQYFWQVFMANGGELASEIWSFRLTGGGGSGARPATAGQEGGLKIDDRELRELLAQFLGMNVVRELERGNYELLDIELHGQRYSGELAVEELQRLIEKLREGKVKINRNPRQ